MTQVLPKVHVVSFGPLTGLVVYRNGGTAPQFLLPASFGSIQSAEPIDSDTALVVLDQGGEDKTVNAVDLATGRILRQTPIPKLFAKLAVSRDRARIFFYGGGHFSTWDARTFECLQSFDGLKRSGDHWSFYKADDYYRYDKQKGQLFHTEALEGEFRRGQKSGTIVFPNFKDWLREDADGTLRIGYQDTNYQTRTEAFGYFRIRADFGQVDFFIIEAALKLSSKPAFTSISSDGRRAIGLVRTAAPIADCARKSKRLTLYGQTIPNVINHPDVRRDGNMRFGLEMKLWDLSSIPPSSKPVIVRMLTIEEIPALMMSPNYADIIRGLEFRIAYEASGLSTSVRALQPTGRKQTIGNSAPTLLDLPAGGTSSGYVSGSFRNASWLADNSGVWISFSDWTMRRVDCDGTLHPLISFERFAGEQAAHIPATSGFGHSIQELPDGRLRVHVGNRMSLTLPVVLPPAKDGLIKIGLDEDGFEVQRNISAAFEAYGWEAVTTPVRLPELTLDGVRIGLKRMHAILAERLRDVIGNGYLRFKFVLANGDWLDEKEFFGRIAREKLTVGPELRAVVTSYLNQIEGGERMYTRGEIGMLWHGNDDDEAPALGYAMRALLLVEPTALDVFREFIAKRDAEHEGYCRTVIWRDYLASYGYFDRDVLRFGIFVAVNALWGGYGYSWQEHGLIEAAQSLLSAEEFGDLILGEIESVEADEVPFAVTFNAYLSTLCDQLSSASPYASALLKHLMKRRASLVARES